MVSNLFEIPMNRGLHPILDALDMDGCPLCGEHPVGIQVNGPQDIRLTCGHVIDAKEWADENYENLLDER